MKSTRATRKLLKEYKGSTLVDIILCAFVFDLENSLDHGLLQAVEVPEP